LTNQPTTYTVTAIEPQVKRPDRYSVFLNGKFWCGLSAQGLLDSKLRQGDELSKQQATELKEKAQTDALFSRTLDWLSRRPRSKWEVEQYLRKKEVPPSTIDDFMQLLAEKQLINDESFASSWVVSRRLLKPISRRKLQAELRQKRVSDEIIQYVLEQDDADELVVLKDMIIKRRQQTRYRDDTKLMQYLSRQGFNYGDIKQAFEELASQ
jgi:regulatory protein